jgi:iron complex transport system substrate-binding protein
LGEENRIVGIDTTSLFPPEALKKKPNVGYFRALSAEGILSLTPNLVVAAEGAGPPGVIDQIRQAAIPFVLIPDEYTPEGVVAKIEAVGRAVGDERAAGVLAARVKDGFRRLTSAGGPAAAPRRVLFVMSFQNGRPLVAGRGTAADAIIRLAGAVNAAEGLQGYKAMTDEAVVADAPDAILTMRQGPVASEAAIFSAPSFAATPAARHKRLIAMDGLYLLGFGPRTPQAVRDLRAAIYADPAQGSPAPAGQGH